MALTRRARRRLRILGFSLAVVAGLGVGAWFTRQAINAAAATAARAVGMAAASEGEWEVALSNLSLAMARNQGDLEALLVLAEARSRVPEPNNRHLATAMSYYTRAAELAKAPGVDVGRRRAALGGRARMELATRSILRLEGTAQEILNLDPADGEALAYLFEIKKIRGEYLPDAADLIVRGDRSDAAWLQALRDVNTLAALRWALERLVLAPDDLDRREQVLAVLREGGSEDLQLMRTGSLRESTLDLVRSWAAAAGESDPMPQLVLALEHLRRNEIEDTRTAIDLAEEIGIDDPALLLRAVSIREALQTQEDLTRAAELLQRAEEVAVASPAVAMNIAIRHWNAGRSDDAFRVLDAVQAGSASLDVDQKMDLVANAALLAVLDERPDAATRLETLESMLATSALEPDVRELLRQVADIARVARSNRPTEEELQQAQTAAAALPGNPLVQTAFGDALARAGLQSLANEAWARAGEMVGQRSLPIGRRGVRGLLEDQSVIEAFRQGVRYAAGTRTLASAIALCEAWLALEASGLNAREVEPRFTDFETPLDLVQSLLADVESSDGEIAGLLPLLAEAAVRQGDRETAVGAIDRAIRDQLPNPILLRLAAISQSNELDRDAELLSQLREQAGTEAELDQVVILEAAQRRRAGRPDEALEVVRDRFGGRTDDDGRRTLGLELLDHAMATGSSINEAVEILVALPTNDRVLRRLQRAAIAAGNPEASLAVVDRARTQHGAESVPTILAEAEHVLGFESTESDSVRMAILRVDPVVSSGSGGAELELALVRLLQLSDPPQIERALDVLRNSRRLRPGRFDTAVLLIDLLQQAGRFDEAAEQVQTLYRRRAAAPPDIQRLIPTMLAGQGDEGLVAESVCELAERTGRPLDRLECARARYRIGDTASADAILDELLTDPDRPFAVDIDAGARLLRRGEPDAAVALLQESSAFPSPLERDLAIARLLLLLERWGMLAELLDSLGEAGDESAEAQLIRAILLLEGPDRNASSARLALDRAVELAPEDVGILRRNVTTRLGDPDLRGSSLEAIDLLARSQPEEAEVMRLAFDASPGGEQFTPSDEHVVRAQAIVKSQPSSRAAWALGLDILAAAYDRAFADVDSTTSIRRAEQLIDMAEGAVGRFPADLQFPIQLSQFHLALGNLEDALAAAREGLRRAGEDRRLGNVIQVATVELRMARPEAALRILEPFRPEIEAGPEERPQAWGLLFTSLLRIGRVDDAWAVYRSRASVRESGNLVPWLLAAESAPPAAALQAVTRAISDLPPGLPRLPAAGALVKVYRRTGDGPTRAMIDTLLDDLEGAAHDPTVAMQIEFARLSADELTDPIGTMNGYASLVDGLPPGIVDRLKRFESLSQAERQEVAPVANLALMAMNNFAAVTADSVLDGRVSPDQAGPALERAGRICDDLAVIASDSPQILDTRALVALAQGRGGKAVQLVTDAIKRAPQVSAFRFTLARGLAIEGRRDEAIAQAREAIRLYRREPEPDEDSIEEIRRFMQALEG